MFSDSISQPHADLASNFIDLCELSSLVSRGSEEFYTEFLPLMTMRKKSCPKLFSQHTLRSA